MQESGGLLENKGILFLAFLRVTLLALGYFPTTRREAAIAGGKYLHLYIIGTYMKRIAVENGVVSVRPGNNIGPILGGEMV